VRSIRKTIDPQVFRALCTMHGGDETGDAPPHLKLVKKPAYGENSP
jgi:hypothetical protein